MPRSNATGKKDNAKRKNDKGENTLTGLILTQTLKITLIYKKVEQSKVLIMKRLANEWILA